MLKRLTRYLLATVLLTSIIIPFCVPMPVEAAVVQYVTITATPDWTSPFTVTLINDTQVDISWTIPIGADRVMVRAKYKEYPTDPGGGVEPSDGYLVYFGSNLSVSDTSMDLDESPGRIYYRIWSVTPAPGNVWSSAFGEDFVEGIGMQLIAFIILPIGLMIAGLALKNQIILVASAAGWAVLGFYSYSVSDSASSTAITDVYMGLFWLCIAMIIASIFVSIYLKPRPEDKAEEVKLFDDSAELEAEFNDIRKETRIPKIGTRKRRKFPWRL